jgi:holo-[acyl-carrier-protein] synthase
MIIGIGTDIVEIRRIDKIVNRTKGFLNKAFTEIELQYFNEKKLKPENIAGRFAAKEAVAKALGSGFRGFGLKDIEIGRDNLGKPIVELKGRAKELAESQGAYTIHLSISHGEDNAIAYAIFEKI